MTVWLAVVIAAAIGIPHLVSLEQARPAVGVMVWLSALALRALTAVFVALFVVFFLPASDLFGLVTHWCWHAVLPVITAHLGLNGHQLGDAATVAPSLVLAASSVSVAVGVWRAARAMRRFVHSATVGRGPEESVIVGGPEVIVAVAGIARPKLLVSAGALAALDDEELTAGLDHERGHIARRHRFIVLLAELCRALGRFLPGTRAAMRELTFHLERDADRWALERRNNPLALASAICKAATPATRSPALATLAGDGGPRRVAELLDPARGRASTGGRIAMSGLATLMVSLALSLTATIPATAVSGAQQVGADHGHHHCQS
jgi:hypothetical protein